ncbi:hypothetical protein D3C75_515700 [compost metagenome]
MVRHRDHFNFALREVFNDNFYRIQNRHRTRRVLVQVVTDTRFQGSHFNGVVLLGHTNALTEFTNRSGSVTTTTQTRDGRHTWVIPTLYNLLSHQLVQLALGHDGVFEIQA